MSKVTRNFTGGLTEDSVGLAVFVARIGADERAKVVVFDLFLVTAERDEHVLIDLTGQREEVVGNVGGLHERVDDFHLS